LELRRPEATCNANDIVKKKTKESLIHKPHDLKPNIQTREISAAFLAWDSHGGVALGDVVELGKSKRKAYFWICQFQVSSKSGPRAFGSLFLEGNKCLTVEQL